MLSVARAAAALLPPMHSHSCRATIRYQPREHSHRSTPSASLTHPDRNVDPGLPAFITEARRTASPSNCLREGGSRIAFRCIAAAAHRGPLDHNAPQGGDRPDDSGGA